MVATHSCETQSVTLRGQLTLSTREREREREECYEQALRARNWGMKTGKDCGEFEGGLSLGP
jgi:hypothetical protein